MVANLPVPESELERGAIAALGNIKTRLDSYLKRTLATDSRLVFRDFEKNYGSVQLDRSRLEIYLHMTVEPK